jgi:hypothetical protein
MTRGSDRERILARRAAFVGSALALLGCSPAREAESPPRAEPGAVVAVPEPADEGASEALPAKRPKPAAGRPPLDVPEGVSEVARKRFESQAKQMQGVYDLIDAIAVPERCDVTSPSCESDWRKLADDLLELGERARFIRSPCKGSSESAKLFEQRSEQHAAQVEALRQQITEEIEQAIAAGGELAKQRWQKIEADARRSRPVVCLSFGCTDW